MLIDAVKVFPKSCFAKGIDILIIDTSNITKMFIDESVVPAEYIVQVGKIEYKFSSIDYEPNGALEGLSTIVLCEKLPSLNKEISKGLGNKGLSKPAKKVARLCKENLEHYKSLYGVTTWPSQKLS